MISFSVDTEKCTQCGECVRDCLYSVLGMDEHPYVREGMESKCIGCQHCLAVCKPGAISVLGKNPGDSLSLKRGVPDPEQMETLILGRRSIRRYKKEGVDPALIRHLLEVVNHAPTAVNQRQTHLTVVDDPESMDKLRKQTTGGALKAIQEGRLPEGMERIAYFLENGKEGEDVIFRGAPHLLVASAPEHALNPMVDCTIAMSYFELLANSHGLGTVWDGIARAIMTAIVPEIRTLLGIPEDHIIVNAMAFGKPAVKYHRAIQPPEENIRCVSL